MIQAIQLETNYAADPAIICADGIFIPEPPCTRGGVCKKYETCQAGGLACGQFVAYSREMTTTTGEYGDRTPTRQRYLECFPEETTVEDAVDMKLRASLKGASRPLVNAVNKCLKENGIYGLN